MRRRRLVPLTAFTLAVGILIGIGVLLAGRGRVPRDDPPNDSSLKRLAVLPFENLGDSADAYFADGMTDAVRGKLTALPGLQVIARNSSSQYQPTAKSAKQIGRELGVDYILAGTVRWDRGAAGARVLVSPELITVATEAATWQQPFNAEMRDVFQVQADLAGQVAAALGLELGAAARKRLAESPTASLAAYDAYLRGNAIATRRGLHDRALARQAVAQYEQAIALDSNFVEAWADLASVYALQYSDGPRSLELADAARRAAERTRSLAPGRSEGHLALGGYYSYVLEDQPRAQAELAEGERIDPNNASLLNRLGYVEWRLGQVGVALQHMERSAKLDPRSATAAGVLGRARLWLRHYPEAVAATDRALSLAPTDLDKREFRAMVSLAQGDLAGARAVLRAAPREVGPTDLVAYVADYFDLAWVLDDEQQQLLLRLRPSAFDGDRSIWAGVLAQTYALRGDSIRSRAYADSARRALEGQLRDAPDEPDLHMRLAIALAYLDRDAEALREGERALGLGGVSKDAVDAPYYRHQLVRLHLLAGQPEKALDHLEPLLKIPYYLSPGWLKIDPTFDPLRGNSRFERLLEETS
jgi:serine/threonine-protein kinase